MSSQESAEKALPKSVRVSFDRLKLRAFLKVAPEVTDEIKCEQLTEIIGALEAMGIKNIDRDAVATLLNNIEPDKSAVIAKGVPPKRGKDGQIQYHFDTNRQRTVMDHDHSGRMDHRERNLIRNVGAGETLATATPPEPGTPGSSVLGDDIPAPTGKPARIRTGRGVRLEEDGLKAVAAHDGMVAFDGDRIVVRKVYRVNEDLDYETGNVRFSGDVIVGRHVNEDFKVEATGNVEVFGNVDKGHIEAGGSVDVKGGILGKKGVSVIAKGDVTTSFADNATIIADGCVTVRGEVLRSLVQADKVVLEGVKGTVLGSVVRADHEIRVTEAGNPDSETKTLLQLGPDPKVYKQIKYLKAELEQVQKDSGEAHRHFAMINKIKKKQGGALANRAETHLNALRDRIHAAKKREMEISSQIEELERQLHDTAGRKIVISGKAYPGTRINILGASLDITDTVTGATFTNEEGTIVTSP